MTLKQREPSRVGGSKAGLYPETSNRTLGAHLDFSRSKTEVERRCGELAQINPLVFKTGGFCVIVLRAENGAS